jgi:DNA-binding GntR family transcriptional regulator
MAAARHPREPRQRLVERELQKEESVAPTEPEIVGSGRRLAIELNEPLVQRRLSDVIYDALLDAVITGSLPPGQLLHDSELAQDLNVSRTPVREALQRLTEIGLVEISPGRFTRVAPVDRAHIADVCRLGGQALALAIELATPQLSPADLAILERENAAFLQAISDSDSSVIQRSVWAFYEVFTIVADRPVFSEAVARLAPHVARWAYLHHDWDLLPALASRREQILAEVQSGDGEAAARLVRDLWNDLADSIASAPTPTAAVIRD